MAKKAAKLATNNFRIMLCERHKIHISQHSTLIKDSCLHHNSQCTKLNAKKKNLIKEHHMSFSIYPYSINAMTNTMCLNCL